jgi:hypothetical protein
MGDATIWTEGGVHGGKIDFYNTLETVDKAL